MQDMTDKDKTDKMYDSDEDLKYDYDDHLI